MPERRVRRIPCSLDEAEPDTDGNFRLFGGLTTTELTKRVHVCGKVSEAHCLKLASAFGTLGPHRGRKDQS